jgi:hypothetical protein
VLGSVSQERGGPRYPRPSRVRVNMLRWSRRADLTGDRRQDPVGDTQDDVQEATGRVIIPDVLGRDPFVVVVVIRVVAPVTEPAVRSDGAVVRGEEVPCPQQDLSEVEDEDEDGKQ